jgi:hypothetical protein
LRFTHQEKFSMSLLNACWTGVVAKLLQICTSLDPQQFLEYGKGGAVLYRDR